MNTIQRKEIKKNIAKINEMGLGELNLFTQKLYLAKVDLPEVIFDWTLKACDTQMAYLMERSEHSACVVMSEIEMDET